MAVQLPSRWDEPNGIGHMLADPVEMNAIGKSRLTSVAEVINEKLGEREARAHIVIFILNGSWMIFPLTVRSILWRIKSHRIESAT